MADTITSHGLVWRIGGREYVTNTTITLLMQGRYARALREQPALVRQATERLAQLLRVFSPIRTGRLRGSIRIGSWGNTPSVILGPEKFNRQAAIARMEGRTYRPRKRNPKLTGFYALPANRRSRRPNYIERAIDVVSREITREIDNLTQPLDFGTDPRRVGSAVLAARALGPRRFDFSQAPDFPDPVEVNQVVMEQAKFAYEQELRRRLAGMRFMPGLLGRRILRTPIR